MAKESMFELKNFMQINFPDRFTQEDEGETYTLNMLTMRLMEL